MANDRFAIFQLKNEELYKPLRRLPYKELRAQHLRADVRNYTQVYMSALRKKDTAYTVFHRLMYQLPADFKGNPIQTSDVIVLNVERRVSAFYVDGHSLVLLPGFASNMAGDSKIIQMDTEDYVVEGKNGTWTAVQEVVMKGIPFYIMKNEHDPTEKLLLMSFDGRLVAENFMTLTESVKEQANHHLETWQKYYENGEYLRAQGDMAGSMVNYSRVDGNKGNQDRDYSEEVKQAQVGVGMARNEKTQARQETADVVREKKGEQTTQKSKQAAAKQYQSLGGDYRPAASAPEEEKPRMLHGRPSLADNLRIMLSRVAAKDSIDSGAELAAEESREESAAAESPAASNIESDTSLLDIPERNKSGPV